MRKTIITIFTIFLFFCSSSLLWADSTQNYSNVIKKPVSIQVKKISTPEPPTVTVKPVSSSEEDSKKNTSFGVDIISHLLPDNTSVFAYEIYGLHYFGKHDNGVRYGARAGGIVISSSHSKPFSTQVVQGSLFLYADTELSEKFILECGILGVGGIWENYEKYKSVMSLTESNMIGISYKLCDLWILNVSGRISFDIVTTKTKNEIETNLSFGLRYQV